MILQTSKLSFPSRSPFLQNPVDSSYLSMSQKSSRTRGKKEEKKDKKITSQWIHPALIWYLPAKQRAIDLHFHSQNDIMFFIRQFTPQLWRSPGIDISYRTYGQNGRSLRTGVLFSVYREYVRAFVFIT